MKGKVLIAALVGLVLAACPCAMALASAAQAESHSCCPAPASPDEQGSDCCLRAAAPAGLVLVAPRFVEVGSAFAPSAEASAEVERLRPALADPSPPEGPSPPPASSRAPPVVLA